MSVRVRDSVQRSAAEVRKELDSPICKDEYARVSVPCGSEGFQRSPTRSKTPAQAQPMTSPSHRSLRPIGAPLLLALGLLGGFLFPRGLASKALSGPSQRAERELSQARGFSEGFQEVARRVAPAVVSVHAIESGPGGQKRLRQGSGVILRTDGIAVTNNHVVRDTGALQVLLADGQRLEAEVVGTDPETDLAVLRILRGSGLVAAPLLADRAPEIGGWVLAIGNPHGYSHTITAGIISARGRTDLDIALYEDFLQTDAAINPGNSGGPLVDLDGRVVGINTAIGSPGSGAYGLGFAIPGHLVRMVVDGILEEGRVRRGWLGVRMGELSAQEARRLGYTRPGLVRVDRILPDTPAEESELRAGDVILSIDGEQIARSQELMNHIAAVRPGRKVQLEVLRARGRTVELAVRLGERAPIEIEER